MEGLFVWGTTPHVFKTKNQHESYAEDVWDDGTI